MEKSMIDYLIHRYDLSGANDVRESIESPGGIDCYGNIPNSIETGWFFAGWEEDIERDMARS